MKRRVVHTNMPIISRVAVLASLTPAAQASNCSTPTMAGSWAFKNLIRTGFATGLLVLSLCLATFGQVVTPAVPQLTEAQAQALLLAGQAGIPLTAEQSQMLVYYLLQKNQSAAGLAYLTPAQVQAMRAQLPQGVNRTGAGVPASWTTQQVAANVQTQLRWPRRSREQCVSESSCPRLN